MKQGDFHAFPEGVTAFPDAGQLTQMTGGDGIVCDMLSIPGEYRGRKGNFEFRRHQSPRVQAGFRPVREPIVWSEEIDAILSTGVSLDPIGTWNWALDDRAAIAALHSPHEKDIPILGGDVFSVNEGRIESTYDSWYCDKRKDESHREFVDRSFARALEYVERFARQALGYLSLRSCREANDEADPASAAIPLEPPEIWL